MKNKSGLALSLSEGSVRDGSVTRYGRATPFEPADGEGNGWFRTKPTVVVLASVLGDVTIADFMLEGAFTEKGAAIDRMTLSGVLDVRQAEAIGRSAESVCRDVRKAGGVCEPCDDGVPACVQLRYVGLLGNRLEERRR